MTISYATALRKYERYLEDMRELGETDDPIRGLPYDQWYAREFNPLGEDDD